jgi:hypothetical protein
VASREDEGIEDGVVVAGSSYMNDVELPYEDAQICVLAWRTPWSSLEATASSSMRPR